MELLDILSTLCSVKAVSGNEDAMYAAACELSPSGAEISRDNIGNISVKFGLACPSHSILLDAHCDQIGFIVTDFCENGFIKVAPVGGIDVRTLYGCRVEVLGKQRLDGVFGTVPPHLQKDSDSNKFPAVDDIAIDVGLSKEKVSELISRGDFAIVKSKFTKLNENRICCAGLDNKAGVAVLLFVLKKLSESGLKNTCVTLLLSVQEELGMRGACAASENCADSIISVDASFADYPGCPSEKTGRLGGGAMLGHAPILSRSLTAALEELAENRNIPLQHEIMNGTTGTNADRLSMCAGGSQCALISLPLLNMHSAVETVDLRDLYSCADLIEAYIREVDARD